MRRGERRLPGRGRSSSPRAYVLTNIATENVTPDRFPQVLRSSPAQLNREIRNAQPRIQRPLRPLPQSGRHNRLRGARLNASRARSATVLRRPIGIKVQRKQQLAQKKPRAHPLVDQAGILGDPAQPRMPRIRALQQRRGVHANLPLERLRRRRPQAFHHACQSAPQHVVVILGPGVPRDPRQILPAELRRIRLWTVIQLPHAQHGPRGRQQTPRIVPQPRATVRQVAHLAGHPVSHPLAIIAGLRHRTRRRDTRQFESALTRQRFDLLRVHRYQTFPCISPVTCRAADPARGKCAWFRPMPACARPPPAASGKRTAPSANWPLPPTCEWRPLRRIMEAKRTGSAPPLPPEIPHPPTPSAYNRSRTLCSIPPGPLPSRPGNWHSKPRPSGRFPHSARGCAFHEPSLCAIISDFPRSLSSSRRALSLTGIANATL